MAGHSKWKQIRRQKGVADARRGQLFTKLAREITVAAKLGGVDPDANFRLRIAVQKARARLMKSKLKSRRRNREIFLTAATTSCVMAGTQTRTTFSLIVGRMEVSTADTRTLMRSEST